MLIVVVLVYGNWIKIFYSWKYITIGIRKSGFVDMYDDMVNYILFWKYLLSRSDQDVTSVGY